MKLDYKAINGRFFTELLRLQGMAPLLVMFSAVVVLLQVVDSAEGLVETAQEVERKRTLPKFTLESREVSDRVYQRYADVLNRISADVDVKAGKEGLEISIVDSAHYPDFMYVLSSVQGLVPNVIWEAESICLSDCAQSQGRAVIKGSEESVKVSLRGSEQ